MGPTWVLSAPDGPHVGPTNLAIRGFTVPALCNINFVLYLYYNGTVIIVLIHIICITINMITIDYHCYYLCGSNHATAAVLLPGFAIN